MHRGLPASLLFVSLVGAGCSAPPPPTAEPGLSDEERRSSVRDQLRASLGNDYDAPLPEATSEQIQRGAKLYGMLCQACHGPTGRGNGRSARMLAIQPKDLADPEIASYFSDRAKLAIIDEGIEGTPMIGWGRMLDEAEQIDVLQFMNTLVREPETP